MLDYKNQLDSYFCLGVICQDRPVFSRSNDLFLTFFPIEFLGIGMASDTKNNRQLVPVIRCPHCWHEFSPDLMNYISTSQVKGLDFDHRLPAEGHRRFLPSKFHVNGNAIDPEGGSCHETACPNCHLKIPRLMAQSETQSFSIFGSPQSGKSYILAAMTHKLRTCMSELGIAFDDADREGNAILQDYEDELFRQATKDTKVRLKKTDLFGDWYSKVYFGIQEKILPKPFLFSIKLMDNHPNYERVSSTSKVICLYDNAGENFQPGGETEDNPVTRHMAHAKGLFFVLDPTQEPTFRGACSQHSTDPQWSGENLSRQDILLGEAISRIRVFGAMAPQDRINTPLVVILAKFDAWNFLLKTNRIPNPWEKDPAGVCRMRFDIVQDISNRCRDLLAKYLNPMLMNIESNFYSKQIFYIPVSAIGCAPSRDESGYYHLAGDINPMWAEVPILTMLKLNANEFLPNLQKATSEATR